MTPKLVFNLYPFNDAVYLPSANIVSVDAGGQLAHILQRATRQTLEPQGIPITPSIDRLLTMLDQLSPKSIELKFKPPKAKTPPALAQLLAEKEIKPSIEQYIYRRLDELLGEIARQKLLLSIDAERKSLVKDVQALIADAPLIPYLSFKKTPAGIDYRLALGTETERFPLTGREVIPLTNTDPAWLLVDYVLFRVPGINGNMVKPFRQKESVQIPPDKERIYFRQFIAKSIRRSRVEAEGFHVKQTDRLRRTRLEPFEHILEGRWMLKPVFEYEGAEFAFGEKRDRVTSLDIPENEESEITVHLVCRNDTAEEEQMEYLSSLGLKEEGRVWFLPDSKGVEPLLDFLSRHKPALLKSGIHPDSPQFEGKTLVLETPEISVETLVAGDWFDVHGRVRVGPYEFPFQKLIGHLRKKDPCFPLPDGSWFLIPETWFTRYADLAESVVENGEKLQLPKSLYTVVEASGLAGADAEFPVIDPEAVAFEPPKSLNAQLRPYQLAGVKWLIGHYREGFGACLADDMGLGKTLQTITLLLHAKENAQTGGNKEGSILQLDLFSAYQDALRPLNALIVLPASLTFNWQLELEKFAPSLYVYAHTGSKRLKDARALAAHDVVLTTYHTARQDLALLEKIQWQFIILDESSQINNRDTEVSRVVRSLHGKHRISLSGTPIENSLADLWTQMEFINPSTLGAYRSFREQFQLPIEKQNDEQAKNRLFRRVKPFFLRRTKEEVAPDLPPLHEQIFYTEMSTEQRKQYDRLKSAVRNEILSLFDDPKTRLQALQALSRLRQMANHPVLADQDYSGDSGKSNDVWAQWNTVRRSGHKVLFFSSYEKHLRLFIHRFEAENIPYARLAGDTAPSDRAAAVRLFQENPEVQAFFITLKAGGVGLNLTAADYVFMLDPWWNPAAEQQAVARAHRIGRERPVTALRFISRDTIEEKILVLQERKKRLGKELFDAERDYPVLEREDVEMLLS